MPRPAKFTHDDVLDAAERASARRWRETTIADVATELGAPVGSIYHRFASRDDLLGSLWLREIRRFHEGFLAAAELADADEAIMACAVHLPRYCRRHPDRAVAMTLYRQPDLVTRVSSTELADEVAHVNDTAGAAVDGLAARRFDRVTRTRSELVLAACQEIPYGLVRSRIGARAPIPRWIDRAVEAAAREVLTLGDA